MIVYIYNFSLSSTQRGQETSLQTALRATAVGGQQQWIHVWQTAQHRTQHQVQHMVVQAIFNRLGLYFICTSIENRVRRMPQKV